MATVYLIIKPPLFDYADVVCDDKNNDRDPYATSPNITR